MSRNQNVEIARILAAFGIVWFHSGAPYAAVGYSGLVTFIALSTFFASAGPAKLARRVLVPWLFWTVFYLGWRFAADGNPFIEGLGPLASILYGAHLWFLPFIFVVNVAVGGLASRHLPLACALLALVMLAAVPWWRDWQLTLGPPLAQFVHALPAALIGVALRTRAGTAIAVLALAVGFYWQEGGVSYPYAIGGGLAVAAVLLPRLPWKVEAVSSCMFGVYLVHIAALGIFNRISGPQTMLTVVLAFLASLVGVWVLRRYLPASRVVLG